MSDSSRERLLAVGVDLVGQRGPAGFTLREAARRSNVSHATPGYLFGDLRGFRTELALGGQRRFSAGMERAEAKVGDPLDRLLAIGASYVAFARREPQMFRMMVGDLYVDSSRDDLRQQRDHAEGPLQRAMGDLHRIDGEVSGEHVPAFLARVRLAWSTVHGVANLIIDGPFAGTDAHEQQIVQDVLTALAPALIAPLATGPLALQ